MNKTLSVSNQNPNSLTPTANEEFLPRETALSVGVAANAKAEIEAQLMMADARPRSEPSAIQKIQLSCARPRLAEDASYAYNKGGTDITGPSIRLLEVIAQKWGNIKWGFHELARAQGESTVMCYAIDLESNARVERMIVVVHEIGLKHGRKKILTDERDIYELIANKAQRRVRTCLENIIPRDIVEDALEQCQKVLAANITIDQEMVDKLVEAFGEYEVTKEMLEAFVQRSFTAETLQPGHILRLRKIYSSLKDGAARAEDWFKLPEKIESSDSSKFEEEEPKPKKEAASKTKQAKKKAVKRPGKTEPTPEKAQDNPMEPDFVDDTKIPFNSMSFSADLSTANSETEVNAVIAKYDMNGISDEDAMWVMDAAQNRKNDLVE